MKKTYIQPTLTTVMVQTGSLLTGSDLPYGQGERNEGEDGRQLAPGFVLNSWDDEAW